MNGKNTIDRIQIDNSNLLRANLSVLSDAFDEAEAILSDYMKIDFQDIAVKIAEQTKYSFSDVINEASKFSFDIVSKYFSLSSDLTDNLDGDFQFERNFCESYLNEIGLLFLHSILREIIGCNNPWSAYAILTEASYLQGNDPDSITFNEIYGMDYAIAHKLLHFKNTDTLELINAPSSSAKAYAKKYSNRLREDILSILEMMSSHEYILKQHLPISLFHNYDQIFRLPLNMAEFFIYFSNKKPRFSVLIDSDYSGNMQKYIKYGADFYECVSNSNTFSKSDKFYLNQIFEEITCYQNIFTIYHQCKGESTKYKAAVLEFGKWWISTPFYTNTARLSSYIIERIKGFSFSRTDVESIVFFIRDFIVPVYCNVVILCIMSIFRYKFPNVSFGALIANLYMDIITFMEVNNFLEKNIVDPILPDSFSTGNLNFLSEVRSEVLIYKQISDINNIRYSGAAIISKSYAENTLLPYLRMMV